MSRRLAQQIELEKAQRADARRDVRLDWFRAAKFGGFVHWGLYALPDRWTDRPARADNWTQEWVQQARQIPRDEYARLVRDFKAEHFDADTWVELFKRAGQEYLIVTAKHHDGFCLFDTDHTDFNVVDTTPFGRDIVGELASTCRRAGMRFGVYYSQTQDWHHCGGHGNDWDIRDDTSFQQYLEELVEPQVAELLRNYGDIAVLWFDTPMIMTAQQSRALLDLVHSMQPDCLVNGRVGSGLGDYATTRDNQFLTDRPDMDWECPATMNDTWGYRASDNNWKSVDELLADLHDVNAKGGNYLLNVGPDGSGRIPQPSIDRLREIGQRLNQQAPAGGPEPK